MSVESYSWRRAPYYRVEKHDAIVHGHSLYMDIIKWDMWEHEHRGEDIFVSDFECRYKQDLLGDFWPWLAIETDRLSPREHLATRSVVTPEERFRKETRYYSKIKDKLLATEELVGKYVAIIDEEVVDADANESELVRRVYEKHGYVPIYVEKVAVKRRVAEVPSPELR